MRFLWILSLSLVFCVNINYSRASGGISENSGDVRSQTSADIYLNAPVDAASEDILIANVHHFIHHSIYS